MKKVKDRNGNIISGVAKQSTSDLSGASAISEIMKQGSSGLIVTDNQQYKKYMHQKQSAEKINELENEVDELKQMVKSLLEKIN